MMHGLISILLVDDDEAFAADLISLMSDRYEVTHAGTGLKALDEFQTGDFDAVLLDIDLGHGMNGFEVLEQIRASAPDLPVIMVTKKTSSASAVASLKKGATDFIDKKPNLQELEKHISGALDRQRLAMVNRTLRRDIEAHTGPMIGDSAVMKALHEEIRLAAETSSPVLISGETGTGKELVAREIHKFFQPAAPFVPINCAAVPRELFEARLFGNERGAFTGADKMTQGIFELAGEGVLFLDEITEIESGLQAKLLRIIEECSFERIGGNRCLRFKGKVLASTNQDLQDAIASGAFRRDLYYRFSTFVLHVPPLHERRGDIALLARHFLHTKAVELKKPEPPMPDALLTRMCAYDWPGNVRELENTIEAYVVRGALSFPAGAPLMGPSESVTDGVESFIGRDIFTMPYQDAKDAVTEHFKRRYVETILAACGGDVHEAARRMGLSRFGLQKIMKELGM